MKIATIVGARPQFIKASAVSAAISKHNSLIEIIIHTGQHYDYQMSKVFFDQLDIPKPNYNLEVGSGTHAFQTGTMLMKIEEVLQKEKPDLVLVYGDTNSTLAGALVAAKLNIPVAHIEAGMRSFNREMPEEINRVLTDHVSSLLFCSTDTAVKNLKNEGFSNIQTSLNPKPYTLNPIVINTGDVMYDVALKSIAIAERKSNILKSYKLKAKRFYLATVHRQSNTDNAGNLKNILNAFAALDKPVVFPVHPRTKKVISSLRAHELTSSRANIIFTEPVGYLDMLMLEKNAHKILTDSGGVQKEAYFFKVPCITLREETEWLELVKSGWNILAGTEPKRILKAAKAKISTSSANKAFGNGRASEKICKIIAKQNL